MHMYACALLRHSIHEMLLAILSPFRDSPKIVLVHNTVEPPNRGHIGSRTFVPYSEVVPISEVPIKLSCIP